MFSYIIHMNYQIILIVIKKSSPIQKQKQKNSNILILIFDRYYITILESWGENRHLLTIESFHDLSLFTEYIFWFLHNVNFLNLSPTYVYLSVSCLLLLLLLRLYPITFKQFFYKLALHYLFLYNFIVDH